MVDIAFLLLIFYMATTQFKPPEARAVDLPSSHSIIELPDKDIVTVTVTRSDSVYVDYLVVQEVTIDGVASRRRVRRVLQPGPVELGRAVRNALNERATVAQQAPMVILKADRYARFESIDRILASLQTQKINRFLIVTEKTPPEGA
jgi:biopolymer transport protein ExbD